MTNVMLQRLSWENGQRYAGEQFRLLWLHNVM